MTQVQHAEAAARAKQYIDEIIALNERLRGKAAISHEAYQRAITQAMNAFLTARSAATRRSPPNRRKVRPNA